MFSDKKKKNNLDRNVIVFIYKRFEFKFWRKENRKGREILKQV